MNAQAHATRETLFTSSAHAVKLKGCVNDRLLVGSIIRNQTSTLPALQHHLLSVLGSYILLITVLQILLIFLQLIRQHQKIQLQSSLNFDRI